MRKPPRWSDSSAEKKEGESLATESDPLLRGAALASEQGLGNRNIAQGTIRARRSSRSPIERNNQQYFANNSERQMLRGSTPTSAGSRDSAIDGYEAIEEATIHSRQSTPVDEGTQVSAAHSQHSSSVNSRSISQAQSGPYRPVSQGDSNRSVGSSSQPPLLEIPEEIYAVRKSALQVLKPLTKTWVSRYRNVALKPCLPQEK
jgi:hypothetical protein